VYIVFFVVSIILYCLGEHSEGVMGVLVPQCQNMLVTGSPRQGKQAVRCLHINMNESARNHIFGQVVEALRANLDRSNSNYRTAIVALGHIAFLMPEEFKNDMKAIVSRKVCRGQACLIPAVVHLSCNKAILNFFD
jgi:sister-chromatid-cohesion protein PDS5